MIFWALPRLVYLSLTDMPNILINAGRKLPLYTSSSSIFLKSSSIWLQKSLISSVTFQSVELRLYVSLNRISSILSGISCIVSVFASSFDTNFTSLIIFSSVFSVSCSLLDSFYLRFAFDTVNFLCFWRILANFLYNSRLYWKISALSGSLFFYVLIV